MVNAAVLRRRLAAGTVLGLGALAAGCGSHAPASRPSGTWPASSPTSAPTSGTGTAASGLPDYEDDPEVRVLRRFAAALAQDVNHGDATLPRSAAFLTKAGRKRFEKYVGDDIGRHYPGPVPFTPVSVDRDDTVSACLLANGWATRRGSTEPAAPRQVLGVRIQLAYTTTGAWKIDDWQRAPVDCGHVRIREVRH